MNKSRHAYCIIAHTDYYCLSRLVELVDDERNDIFLLFDKKSSIRKMSLPETLLQSSVECKFVQVGSVDNALKNVLVKTDNIEIYDTISVEKSIELKNSAKAIFVPDFESEYPYSPFILSKFVYHIMEDKVIVLYSKKDCEMRDYAINYPEAGIIWAEMGNRESLQSAIIKAMKFDNSKIDRTRIRKCFAEETIVQNFEKALKRILN